MSFSLKISGDFPTIPLPVTYSLLTFFFFFLIIYLFVFDSAGPLLVHRLFSSFGDQGLAPVAARSLIVMASRCRAGLRGVQLSVDVLGGSVGAAPGHWTTGSIVAAHGPSYSRTCRVFLD